MTNTSDSRQLAFSCTWMQSLLKRVIVAGLSSTPAWAQMLAARSG